MSWILWPCAVMLMLLSGCKDAGVGPAGGTDTNQIHIAVYQHQFLHNASGLQGNAGAYYLAVMVMVDSGMIVQYELRDPPASVVQSFAGHLPPVRKYSDCTFSISGVFDRISGARGLLFRVGPAKMIDEDEAEVEGGYFEAGLSASANLYTVKLIDGVWAVVDDRPL